ncbi:alpha/beta fold hydrolase [Janibacter corallicola]|uniref:alpha/beta fold hydrolase n=1 Tax=Janibacter corallicola TaxID=415212 RepID=UPI00082AA4DB|nr:alpha/beta hydrolase [Janibacter corallicola]
MTIKHTLVGNGPTKVITVHGWFGGEDGWGLLPDLVDADAYTFAFFDLRGYGVRADVETEHSLDEVAEDVFALADQLGWDRFALVGHSMGGAMVLRALCRDPERITAVVGVSPVPASGVPLDADSQALFDGAAQDPANRYAIIDFTTGNRQPKSWIEDMVAYSEQHSRPEAVAGYLTSWTGADFVSELPTTRVPVHAVVGEHDPALGEGTMRATWLEQLPGCDLTVIPNAGHYAMFEAPVSLIGAIDATLARAGR